MNQFGGITYQDKVSLIDNILLTELKLANLSDLSIGILIKGRISCFSANGSGDWMIVGNIKGGSNIHGLLNEDVGPKYFSGLIGGMESQMSFMIVKLGIGKDQSQGLVVEKAERQISSGSMPI